MTPNEPRDGSWELPPGTARKAIDAALREIFPGTSWNKARNLVTTGKVKVGDEVVLSPTRYVRAGDKLTVKLTSPRPTTTQRVGREIIAYVDPHVVVVRKPPGISTVPFDERETNTLDELVRAHLSRAGRSSGGRVQGTLGVVHRLDKETSGLLVFARTLAAKKHLSQQFRVHSVHREYRAIVHGDIDDRTFRSRLVADRGDGLRGSTRNPNEGQQAVTHIARVERLGDAARATLIACRLETGRTHQIRIHLAESGHPLVGERVYIRRYNGPRIGAPRIMLHAAELGFVHPHTEEDVHFEEPIPADMETMLSRLRSADALTADESAAGEDEDEDEDGAEEDRGEDEDLRFDGASRDIQKLFGARLRSSTLRRRIDPSRASDGASLTTKRSLMQAMGAQTAPRAARMTQKNSSRTGPIALKSSGHVSPAGGPMRATHRR